MKYKFLSFFSFVFYSSFRNRRLSFLLVQHECGEENVVEETNREIPNASETPFLSNAYYYILGI